MLSRSVPTTTNIITPLQFLTFENYILCCLTNEKIYLLKRNVNFVCNVVIKNRKYVNNMTSFIIYAIEAEVV